MKENYKLLQDAINAIDSYAISTYDVFKNDDKTQDAIMFNLVILGEAANNISAEFQERHPEIPWSSIIGTRNVIVHGYDLIKIQIVWDIIQNNLPPLRKILLTLV